VKQFIRYKDNGAYYAAFGEDNCFKVGAFELVNLSPFWTYETLFNSLEQAELVAEMLADAYQDGYTDGQIDSN
jgi:hypothetical protein